MSALLVVLFLHILLMFVAVTAAFGPSILLRLAYRTGEVANIRAVAHVGHRLILVAPMAFAVAGAFGLLTAREFKFDLTAPWLVLSYVLYGVTVLTGIGVARPWSRLLRAVLDRTPDGPITPELRAVFSDPVSRAANVLDYVIVAALIFVMVVKPALW